MEIKKSEEIKSPNRIMKRKAGLETMDLILETAAELFARSGVDGVSMRMIAEKVGIRESSLYNHFSSKNQLLDTLLNELETRVSESRPSESMISQMLMMMNPEEILKAVILYIGQKTNRRMGNIAQIINLEKFRNEKAAEIYHEFIRKKSVEFYQNLFDRMVEKELIEPIDTRLFAEQYNYIYIAQTKECLMAEQGLANMEEVASRMCETIRFFCAVMGRKEGRDN